MTAVVAAAYVGGPQMPVLGHRAAPAQPHGDPLSDTEPRLAPRSAGAIADTELLRVALADIAGAEADDPLTLAERIRSFLVRFARSDAEPA